MKLMKGFLVSAAIYLSCACLCYAGANDEIDYRESFDKIDRYLTTSVQNNDIESNLAKATAWLKELKTKNRKSVVKSNTKLIAALQLLMRLKHARCSIDDRDVVDANDYASRKPRYNGKKRGTPARRIDMIVHHFAKKHYDECYEDLQKIDLLETQTREYVLKLGERMITPLQEKFAHYLRIMRNYLADQLKTNPPKDYNEKQLPKVSLEDFNKYLTTPCMDLGRMVGDEFWKDLKTGDENENRVPSYDRDLREYFDLMKRHSALKHCQYIVKNQTVIWNQINSFQAKGM